MGHVDEGTKMGNYILCCCVDVIIYPCPRLIVGSNIEYGTVNKLHDTSNNVNAIMYGRLLLKSVH